MASGEDAIAGRMPDQRELRVLRVTTLDDFVAFLDQLEAVFGPTESPRKPITGECFRL